MRAPVAWAWRAHQDVIPLYLGPADRLLLEAQMFVCDFLAVTKEVFCEALGETLVGGTPAYLSDPVLRWQEVNVLMRFDGSMRGIIRFGLQQSAALALVRFLRMEPEAPLDPCSLAIFQDLVAMIAHIAGSRLECLHEGLDFMPPVVQVGPACEVLWRCTQAMEARFGFSMGELCLTFCFPAQADR